MRVNDFVREEILKTLDECKDIELGVILLQSGPDITIFCSKYTVELVGALEILKTKVASEILIPEDED
jgi:hypothetical protein